MTNFEMVETLRQHANVSYEEAKRALEETNWGILEAMVLLEKEGKVAPDEGGAYTTQTEEKPRTEKKDSAFKNNMGRLGKAIGRLAHKGNVNFFQVSRKGELVFEIPVSVLVILLLCPTRWLCLIALVIGLFSSFHYSFRGPDLGREAINNAMDKASDFAENIGKDKEKKNND